MIYIKALIEEELSALPFISGFVGSCSFDLVRHEFPVLQNIALDDHQQHDAKFYMVEDAYIFDHYNEYLYIVATDLFSQRSEQALEDNINRRLELTKVKFSEPLPYEQQEKVITSNVTKQQFMDTVSYMKSLIQQGDMF